MKKSSFEKCIALIILLLLGLSLCACEEQASVKENLLLNGDFSQTDGSGMPEDWYTSQWFQEDGVSLYSVSFEDGTPVAKIENVSKNDARFAQNVKTEEETVYLLHGFIRANCEGGRGAKNILCGLLGVCVLNFAIFEGCAIAAAMQRPADDAKWVLLLGAGVHGDVPSFEFAKRISVAADYLLSHPDAVAVTTGGCGSGEYIEEGNVAAMYLQNAGVPKDRILTEDKSTTTEENFRFARDIIQNAGGNADDKILIVSSGFHLYRAEKLAKAEGYTDLSGLGSTGLLILLPQYYLREYAARVRGSF